MKIVKNIIIPIEFNHLTGGMIFSVISLVKFLSQYYDVYILANKDAEILQCDLGAKHLLLKNPYSVSIKHPLQTIKTYFEIKKLTEKFSKLETIVITNNVGSELSFSGFGMMPISLPRIFVSRGGDYLGKTGWFLKKGFRTVQGFICTSKRQFDILEQLGIEKERLHIIHNGIEDLGRGNIHFSEREVIKLSIVGYLNPEKNQLLAIEAINQLRNEGHFVRLNIFGAAISAEDILYKKLLENKIEAYQLKESVSLKGFESNRSKIYAQTDILISTSISEGFGRVVVEAMSFGLPSIGLTISGGLNDIISNGIDGFLIENNASELVKYIKLLMSDNDLYKKLSTNARNKFLEKFTEKRMCTNYLNFLKKL